MRRVAFSIILLMCLGQVAAQPQYLYTRYGVRDGLSSEKIMAITQDKKGFIWIGTDNSLERFDGQRFISFFHDPANPKTIPDGAVLDLKMDKKGRLWLRAGLEIGYFSTDDFTYHPAPIKFSRDSLAKTLIRLCMDNEGNVVIVPASFGVFMYDEKEGVFTNENTPYKLPEGWKPICFIQDRLGNYWTGCQQGLVKNNPTTKTLSYRGHNVDKDPIIEAYKDATDILFVFRDTRGRFWLTNWPPDKGLKIQSYDSVTHAVKEWQAQIGGLIANKYYEMTGFIELSDRSIWITGWEMFVRMNEESGKFELIPRFHPDDFGIRYEVVEELFEDRERNAWVASNRGLFRFSPSAQLFRTVPSRRPGNDTLFTSDIQTILQLPSGELLAGTWGDGFFTYDKYLNPIRLNEYFQNVTGEGMPWCSILHSSGDVWRGNQSGVLYVTRAGTHHSEKIVDPVFAGSTIRTVAEDKKGNLWYGTQRGHIIKWDVATNKYSVIQQIKTPIVKVSVDSHGDLWVCAPTGLTRINTSNGSIISHYDSKGPEGRKLRADHVISFMQFNDSLYYIGGNGLQILNTKTNSISYFPAKIHPRLKWVGNIIKDRKGTVWVTSETNIVRIDVEKNLVTAFSEQDGLRSEQFTVGAAALLNDGRIAFGHSYNLVIFDPTAVSSTEYSSRPVEFTGFALMNEWLRLDSLKALPEIKLRHDQNSINIQFSALSYRDKHTIFYMMENLDDKWIEAGSRGEASYNYLPAGRYVFKVRSLNAEGKESPVSSLIIHISPPFWRSWWFYSLLLLGGAALLFWFDRERMMRKEAMLSMRSNIAGNLHEEVNVALSNINILSEMARMKADNDPQKSKEFIEQIHSKSHNMIIAMDDMLWSIDPANDSMEKKVERIREYLDALRYRHDINVNIVVDKNVYGLKLNMKQRHEAFLLFKEAIKSLVDAGARDVEVHVGFEKHRLVFAIQFDNEGIDPEQLTNLVNRQDINSKLAGIDAEMDVQENRSASILVLQVKVA